MLVHELRSLLEDVGSLGEFDEVLGWVVVQVNVASNHFLLGLNKFKEAEHPLVALAESPCAIVDWHEIVQIDILYFDQLDSCRPICDCYPIAFPETWSLVVDYIEAKFRELWLVKLL